MTGTPNANLNALDANKKNWDIGSATDSAPKPPAPSPPKAPAPPKAPVPVAEKPFGGLGGGLFDSLAEKFAPKDVGGGSKGPKPAQSGDAIYEDDEMAGGFGTGRVQEGGGEIKMPFR